MEIKVNIDEAKILELLQSSSMEDLPRAVFYQVQKYAIDQAVDEIKKKLVDKPYYGSDEKLNRELSETLYKSIQVQMDAFVKEKFNEQKIQKIVELHTEKVLTEWLEKKIYSRLEELKTDIFIGSYGEIEAERQRLEKEVDELNGR